MLHCSALGSIALGSARHPINDAASALFCATLLPTTGHPVACPLVLDRVGHPVGDAAMVWGWESHSDGDGAAAAALGKADHSGVAHQLRTEAAAAEAAAEASAAALANTAADVVTARRSSTGAIVGVSASDMGAAWISTGEDCILRSCKNSSRE